MHRLMEGGMGMRRKAVEVVQVKFGSLKLIELLEFWSGKQEKRVGGHGHADLRHLREGK